MFRSPKALPGRSLAELGSLVPSELPQGSSELRDSPPSERELQHGVGPAGCAVLLKARFDERLDCCLSGDLGGEEGRAADRAKSILEPPLGGGSGERHVQRMPEAVSEGVFGVRVPLGRQRRHMRNRSPARRNARRRSFLREQRAPTRAWEAVKA